MVQPTLQSFEFDVITVDAEGQETHRTRGQAQSFTEDLGNGIGLDMVLVPGGSFVMGSPETEGESVGWERPQHLVKLSPFFMGKYVVTQAQWLAVSELPKVNHDLDPNCSAFKGLKLPVERVSWWQAVEFCDRLSAATGRQYRLPTEAEWEYGCRAGTTTPFHFGETLTADLANYNGVALGKGWTGSYGQGPKGVYRLRTTDVGSFSPNAFGLYDTHGNVYEWCADHWHRHYQGAPTDGSAWLTDNQETKRLRRGGSWGDVPAHCRAAFRVYAPPDTCNTTHGLRVVCAAP